MSLILGLMGLAAAAAGPDDFTMTLTVSPETPEGQRLIALRAIEICRGRYPMLARYRFTGDERVGSNGTTSASFRVSQELTCSETPPAAPTEPPAPADWQASAQDEADVRRLTMTYFAAVDAGEAVRIHAMMSRERQADEPLATRVEALRTFLAEAGTPGTHRIAALTWYVNPQHAPRPGIYVAVDFERSYSRLVANCGYLVWYREGTGRYVLVREENGSAARGRAGETPENLARVRAMLRCRGN